MKFLQALLGSRLLRNSVGLYFSLFLQTLLDFLVGQTLIEGKDIARVCHQTHISKDNVSWYTRRKYLVLLIVQARHFLHLVRWHLFQKLSMPWTNGSFTWHQILLTHCWCNILRVWDNRCVQVVLTYPTAVLLAWLDIAAHLCVFHKPIATYVHVDV